MSIRTTTAAAPGPRVLLPLGALKARGRKLTEVLPLGKAVWKLSKEQQAFDDAVKGVIGAIDNTSSAVTKIPLRIGPQSEVTAVPRNQTVFLRSALDEYLSDAAHVDNTRSRGRHILRIRNVCLAGLAVLALGAAFAGIGWALLLTLCGISVVATGKISHRQIDELRPSLLKQLQTVRDRASDIAIDAELLEQGKSIAPTRRGQYFEREAERGEPELATDLLVDSSAPASSLENEPEDSTRDGDIWTLERLFGTSHPSDRFDGFEGRNNESK